jgi:hypothetical protein
MLALLRANCQLPQRCCVLAAACSEADAQGRGIVNFGQVLLWYSVYMLGSSRERRSAQEQQQQQQQ